MREGGLQERRENRQNFWNVSGVRVHALESLCPWTVRLLKSLGRFEMTVRAVERRAAAENAAEQFLYQMSASPEPLVFAMARMELAVMRIRQGSGDHYLVEWDRNPELVFQALQAGCELPQAEPAVRYRMHISRDIPGLARCEQTSFPSAQT
jgi:hypothetical protein